MRDEKGNRRGIATKKKNWLQTCLSLTSWLVRKKSQKKTVPQRGDEQKEREGVSRRKLKKQWAVGDAGGNGAWRSQVPVHGAPKTKEGGDRKKTSWSGTIGLGNNQMRLVQGTKHEEGSPKREQDTRGGRGL